MKELIERIECAEGDQTAALLDEAWDKLARDNGIAWATVNARRFGILMDAEAWLSAAEMLVPEGSEWDLTTLYGVARAGVDLNSNEGPSYGSNECGSPALALVAAALKARRGE